MKSNEQECCALINEGDLQQFDAPTADAVLRAFRQASMILCREPVAPSARFDELRRILLQLAREGERDIVVLANRALTNLDGSASFGDYRL